MNNHTLMALFFDGSRFQIENAPSIRRFLRRELLADLFHVVRVQMIVKARAEPVALALVEDWCHAVGHVD